MGAIRDLLAGLTVTPAAKASEPQAAAPGEPVEVDLDPQRIAHLMPAANACVTIISGTMARLPYRVYERREIGPPLQTYVSRLLEQPSRTLPAFNFWELLGRDLFTHGNAIAYIERSKAGHPVELHPARLTQLERRDGRWQYRLGLLGDTTGMRREVSTTEDNVLHLRGAGYDWRTGLSPSPIQNAARSALGLWQLAQDHHRSTLVRGGHSPLFVKTDVAIKATAAAAYADQLRAQSGAARAGRTTVLPPGMDVQKLGFSSIDLQLIELLKWTIGEVARTWSVPLFLLQEYQRSGGWSNANLAEMWHNFARFSLASQAARYEGEFERKLMSARMRDTQRIEVDMDRLTRGTLADQAKAAEILVAKAAVLTPNEVRADLGRAPLPGGDRLRMPTGAPRQARDSDPEGEDRDRDDGETETGDGTDQ